MRAIAIGALLVLSVTGCVAQPGPVTHQSSDSPTATASAAAIPLPSIVIGAQHLTVTDPSGVAHQYPYDKWPADLVSLSTNLFAAAPRTADSAGDGQTPRTTTYLWGGLFLIHSDWPADKSGVDRLTVYAQGRPGGSLSITGPKGVRVGDPAASVAAYPIFCNADKKCFENQETTSGSSTTLRVLDSSGTEPGVHLVLGYVDATEGVTDIITADPSWGTTYGIDIRD